MKTQIKLAWCLDPFLAYENTAGGRDVECLTAETTPLDKLYPQKIFSQGEAHSFSQILLPAG